MGVITRGGLALLLIAGAAACGCGEAGNSGATSASDRKATYPDGPTRTFIVPYGDNAIPLYGREATAAERQQASATIQKWMRARAAKDFVTECRYFSKSFLKSFVTEDAEVVSEGKVKTCPQALAYFGQDASGDFRNTLTGPLDSLRIPKSSSSSKAAGSEAVEQGFAQYHGKAGVDYEIPMNREGGKWLVAAAAPLDQSG